MVDYFAWIIGIIIGFFIGKYYKVILKVRDEIRRDERGNQW